MDVSWDPTTFPNLPVSRTYPPKVGLDPATQSDEILSIVCNQLRRLTQLLEGQLSKEVFDDVSNQSECDCLDVANKRRPYSSSCSVPPCVARNSASTEAPVVDEHPPVSVEDVAFDSKVTFGPCPTSIDDVVSPASGRHSEVSAHSQRFLTMFNQLQGVGTGVSAQECWNLLARRDKHMELHEVAAMLVRLNQLASDSWGQHEPVLYLEGFLYLLSNCKWDAHPEVARNLEALKEALEAEALEAESPDKPRGVTLVRKRTQRHTERRSSMHMPAMPPEPRGWLTFALETIPAFMIMLNALEIGLEADYGSEMELLWEVCELIFAFFFTCECFIKMKIVGCRPFWVSGDDRFWNYFDVFCVCTALLDMTVTYGSAALGDSGLSVDGLMLIKMLRIARLARLVRLLRFKIFVELKMMIQGVVSGVRVLMWAVVLLFMVIFVLGILMRKLMEDSYEEFGTLPAAMFTLFRCFTDGCTAYNGTPLQERLRFDHGIVWMVGYMMVVLFVTIGIFNLIMAIFVDNVVQAHVQRKQQHLGQTADTIELRICEVIARRLHQMDHSGEHVSENLRHSIEQIAADVFKAPTAADYLLRKRRVEEFVTAMQEDERVVNRRVFNEWLQDPEVIDLLEESDVETATKFELFDALDVDSGGELTVEELVSGLMKLRGPISKNDIVATRLKVAYVTELVEDICRKVGVQLACDKSHVKM